MAKQSKSSTQYLQTARRQINRSKRYRESEGLDSLWDRMIDLYEGKTLGDKPDVDEIIVNHVFAVINVIFPSVTVNNPKITVAPNKQEDTDRAIITEAVINYWWKHYKVQPQFRLAAKDYLTIGHGWLKTCWKYDEEEQARDEAEVQGEIEQGLGQLQQAAEENPDLAGDLPDESDVVDAVETKETVVVEDCPHVERVSFRDMFVDPDATDMSNLRWIAQRIYRTIDEVRDDDRYPKKIRTGEIKTSAQGGPEAEAKRPPSGSVSDDRSGFVTVWEYYDIVKRTMCSWADGVEGFLIAPKKMDYTFGHPYVMLRNYDVPDQFYPIGDVEMLESLQLELNKTRTQMIRHRDRGARKWLARESAINAEGRAAIESNDDMRVIPVKGDEDLRSILLPVESQPVSADFYNTSSVINEDILAISGVSEYQRGALPDIRRTATEASILQDAANARSADKLSTIELCIGEVASRLIALAQQYMTGEQVARVVGSDGEYIWVNFDAETIEGEYDFVAEGGSTQPNNESFRRQSAMQLVDAMSPFAQVMNLPELATYVLENGFGIRNPQRFILAPPPMVDPMTGQPLPPPAPGSEPLPPPAGGGAEQPPPPVDGPPPQIPPEILAQLAAQVPGFSSAQLPVGA